MSSLKINDFVKEIGKNAVAHGWHDGEHNFGELLALCHCELSEALEEYRKGKKITETYFTSGENLKEIKEAIALNKTVSEIKKKPEGVPTELADVIIRIFDICFWYGIDIEAAILQKHEYNKTRKYRHGGKLI